MRERDTKEISTIKKGGDFTWVNFMLQSNNAQAFLKIFVEMKVDENNWKLLYIRAGG